MTVHQRFDLESDIKPVSDFRANTATLLRQVRESGRPIVLTQRGRSSVVVVDVGVYQALLTELDELRDIHRGLADIEAGRVVSHEEVVADILGEGR